MSDKDEISRDVNRILSMEEQLAATLYSAQDKVDELIGQVMLTMAQSNASQGQIIYRFLSETKRKLEDINSTMITVRGHVIDWSSRL